MRSWGTVAVARDVTELTELDRLKYQDNAIEYSPAGGDVDVEFVIASTRPSRFRKPTRSGQSRRKYRERVLGTVV
ncbi:MAG: hypothetical protein EPO21_05525 [Chloroflexota bacterium]|nr:MAG: hypothetical protein EPO21_05525 [Chloroflexota bacterium]